MLIFTEVKYGFLCFHTYVISWMRMPYMKVIDTITEYENSERLHLIQMELSDLKESNFDFTETQNYLNRLSKLFKQEYRFALKTIQNLQILTHKPYPKLKLPLTL